MGSQRRSSYLSDCMSPSCVPVHEDHYTRIQAGHDHRRRRLRKLLRKIVSKSRRSIYGPTKPLTFQYDAVSYSQNFDEGCHVEDEYPRLVSASLSRFHLVPKSHCP